jgi:hypothetical protein
VSSGIVQISALVGCAGVALRYVVQLVVVVWSLGADENGRRHALGLLLALRGKRSQPGPSQVASPPSAGHPAAPPRLR